jgi:hypothetical protein
VTFSVYSEQGGTERIFPFDLIPRVVAKSQWETLEEGLVQRIRALNEFLGDVYGEQRILAEGVVPRDLVEGSAAYRPELRGIRPPHGVYIHIGGIDLIRDAEGTVTVLEDNVRTPSGVSYVLENRMMMKKVFPKIFGQAHVQGVEMYPTKLREAMAEISPAPDQSRSVVLTPGPFNSAYFEDSFPRSVVHNLGRTRGLFMRLFADDPHGQERRTWQVLERFRGELLEMRIDDVLRVGIHEVLTWVVDTQAELFGAIHDDYLDPPLETLRRRVQVQAGQSQQQA